MTDLARIPQTPRNLATVPTQSMTESFGIDGLEGLTIRDLTIPRWSIVQPMSKMDDAETHMGQFFNTVDKVFAPALDLVILTMRKTRLLWGEELTDRAPDCSSEDAVTGSRYGACNECRFNADVVPSLWDKPVKGAPKVRRCGEGLRMIVVDPANNDEMSILTAMGTSYKPVSGLAMQFVKRQKPPYGALAHFQTKQETTDLNTKVYLLVPSVKEWLNATDTKKYQGLREGVRGLSISVVDPAKAEEDDTDLDDLHDHEGSWIDEDQSSVQAQAQLPPPRSMSIVPKAPPLRTDAEPELSEANWYRNALDLFNACTAAGIKIAANTRPRSDYGIPWFRDFVDYWTDELREHNSRVHAARK